MVTYSTTRCLARLEWRSSNTEWEQKYINIKNKKNENQANYHDLIAKLYHGNDIHRMFRWRRHKVTYPVT